MSELASEVWIEGEDQPRGLCWCGCGEATRVSRTLEPAKGYIPGVPRKFLRFHHLQSRTDEQLRDHILTNISIDDNGCWIWPFLDSRGYGRLEHKPRNGRSTHRLSYEVFVGEIPDGLHIDHLCFVPACCNPGHLEPVTPQENRRRVRRRPDIDTHCAHGHKRTPENSYYPPGGRGWSPECRTCERIHRARARLDALGRAEAESDHAGEWLADLADSGDLA